MSEYQYYEFQALDRTLSKTEMDELRRISSRAEITPTRFVNTYNYGDFRGGVTAFMTRYFDIMVYVTNWGTHQFSVRLPGHLVDQAALEACCDGHLAVMEVVGDAIVFNFKSYLEDYGGWEEGEGYLEPLIPVREEMLRGDLRAPYLAWLMCAQYGELDYNVREPFVPPGLKSLSSALQSLADYLRLDEDLLAAAAEGSPEQSAMPEGIQDWVAALPEARKNQLLLSLIEGDGQMLGAILLREYRSAEVAQAKAHGQTEPAVRSVDELLATAERNRAAREAEEQRRAEEERARQAAAAAAARAKGLDILALRQEAAWQDVERLITLKQAKPYQEAANLLKDLAEISKLENKMDHFQHRFVELRQRHEKKRTFWKQVADLQAG